MRASLGPVSRNVTRAEVADLHCGVSHIAFTGAKPPDLDVPLIELEATGGGVVDLYNECRLTTVVLEGSQLGFDFLTLTGSSVRVLFREISRLRVEQPPDWDPREADQIEHLLIRREGAWPRVVFKAGGLSYEFDATELVLVTAQTDQPTSPSR
jgi:hypothetical protein